jgi:hypothetical protein
MVESLYIDAMAGRVVLIQINSIKTKYVNFRDDITVKISSLQ